MPGSRRPDNRITSASRLRCRARTMRALTARGRMLISSVAASTAVSPSKYPPRLSQLYIRLTRKRTLRQCLIARLHPPTLAVSRLSFMIRLSQRPRSNDFDACTMRTPRDPFGASPDMKAPTSASSQDPIPTGHDRTSDAITGSHLHPPCVTNLGEQPPPLRSTHRLDPSLLLEYLTTSGTEAKHRIKSQLPSGLLLIDAYLLLRDSHPESLSALSTQTSTPSSDMLAGRASVASFPFFFRTSWVPSSTTQTALPASSKSRLEPKTATGSFVRSLRDAPKATS